MDWRSDREWMVDAACRGLNANIFHPHDNNNSAAVTICNRCSVRTKCLDYAMTNEIWFGIWGGTTERERSRIAGKRYDPRRVGLLRVERGE